MSRDLPILFNGAMVRAILREIEQPGTGKTQTRRLLTADCDEPPAIVYDGVITAFDADGHLYRWPRTYGVGDRLYVRESYSGPHGCRRLPPRDWPVGAPIWYWADGDPNDGDWTKPKPAMPRWASRITLTVTDVRVQRLQDISENDALAEGVPIDDDYAGSFEKEYCRQCGGSSVHSALGAGYGVTEVDCAECETATLRFRNLWDHLNAKRAPWESNPWVAAYTFRPELSNRMEGGE